MNNRFIACGGTGAHVMLAMVRLHILGYPFGFFFKTGNNLPDLFLVDQDSGDGKDKDARTPWQEVKHLVRIHPGKYNLGKYLGRPDTPICKNVSPLPVGKNKDWYKPPYHQLKYQFRDSLILDLITSEEQRKITFDIGMMASPAVGSLLFSLKELDHDEKSNNYDESYNEMLDGSKERRIVVCGSSVGGTGSSVAPTLARLCNDKKAEVMAVMIHNWFKFSRPDESREIFEKSVERNKRMKQNAAGGLACYGHELADSVPTVLVGVPEHKRILRDYTSDNQQPFKDSYAHAVGALAGIKHFMTASDSENKIREGLYGVSASDASLLTGDLIIRDKDEASLKTMVGHAQILTCLLKVYSKLLRTTNKCNLSKEKSSVFNFFNFAGDTPFPSIAHWAYTQLGNDTASLKYAANELDLIVENYEDILEWIKSLGVEKSGDLYYDSRDVDMRSKESFCGENQCLKRLKNHQLPDIKELRNSRLSNLKDVEIVALSLFHWVADWITDDWEEANLSTDMEEVRHGQGYWPDIKSKDDTGLVPNWKKPGELGKVEDGKVITSIQNHFDRDDVSPNSWPHPFAVTEQFKFQIANGDPIALRKLEMLLVGQAIGILEFKKVDEDDKKGGLSLERLIKGEDIAQSGLRHKQNSKIYGFNSPQTLFCPAPDVADEDWEALKKDIVESDWVDWKSTESFGESIKKDGEYVSRHSGGTASKITEKLMSGDEEKFSWKVSTDWGDNGERARQAIKGWIKCTKKYIQDKVDKRSRTWFDVFDEHLISEAGPFGIADWLSLPGKDIRIPVPILGPSTNIFEEGVPNKEEAEKGYLNFLDTVPEFKEYSEDPASKDSEVFELIEDFHIPGSEFPMKAIWKEHLDGLQTLEKIFAWEIDDPEKGLWIMQDLGDSPIYIRDLLVIDKDVIQIETCIPLEQKRIAGSRTKEIKYPDIPLHPEFIDLLKVPKGEKNEGERCLIHDDAWKALQQSGVPDPGRKLIRWTLDLRGRSKSFPVTVSMEGIEATKAHWMIWPNFKSDYNPSQPNDQWRAYYVFEQSDRKSLEIQTIYIDPDLKNPLQKIKSPPGCSGHAYALNFKDGYHSGGPPIALSAYDMKLKDTGIYIIGLTKRSHDQEPWKLAIDFGTSHTVAAYQISDGPESVNLNAELASGESNLTLHISENHDDQDISQMGFDLWRPTYLKESTDEIAKAMLPSDLWSVEEVQEVNLGEFKSEWSPMTHYSIPVIQLQRSNIRSHIISGFKWDLNDGEFRNQEQWLRERYLRMAIEIFVADIVKGKSKKLPSKIDTTFTYPLRGTFTQATSKFEEIIKKIIKDAHKDLGIAFSLQDGRGMYSESHAAFDSVGDGIPINVKLVADLGGGTLDILIRTYDIPIERSNDRFKEVADSVKIGSDLMLKVLAENPNSYLPKGDDRGWEQNSAKAFEQLRAWMRAVGSDKLYGKETENWHAPNLKLWGFEKSRDGNDGREIINRYFRIIVDFLARYLVAYVANDVWPILKSDPDRAKLKLLVNLRGNGWRLYHGSRDYQSIQQDMEKLVQSRAQELWADSGISDPLPDEVWHTADLSHENSPKLVPIKKALGKSMNPVSARNNSHRYPLSNVMVYGREQVDTQKHWNERLPFEGVRETDSLHIEKFDPPLVVKASGSGEPLAKIEDPLMKEINDKISGGQVVRDSFHNTVDAPIALLIWENLLKSDKFRKL